MDDRQTVTGFTNARGASPLYWFNAPPAWSAEEGTLALQTAPESDFWQRTNYGFQKDDGHLLYTVVHGAFTMEGRVSYRLSNSFDQAGVMVRIDEECWIKACVELEQDGSSLLGVVVTNHGYSDWSVQEYGSKEIDLTLHVERRGLDYFISYRRPDGRLLPIRTTHLHAEKTAPVMAGLFACSPGTESLSARFISLHVA